MILFYKAFLNGSSKAMNVNGSGTPVVFTYSPGGGQTVSVKGISILLNDEGTTSLNKFGAITALTNGLLIKSDQTNQGVGVVTLGLLKDNGDLCNMFPDFQHFGNSAVLSILSIVTPEGFGNTNNIFKGKLDFGNNICLVGSDSLTVTVQDNLTSIGVLEMGVHCYSDS